MVLVNAGLSNLLINRNRRNLVLIISPLCALYFILVISIPLDFLLTMGFCGLKPNSYQAVIIQNENGTIDDLLRLSLLSVKRETRLVVWPEYALPEYLLSDRSTQRDLQALQGFCRQHQCTLVLGTKEHAPNDAPCDWLRRRNMKMVGDELFYNIALVIGPDSATLGKYAKTHPIQFFADGVPGRTYQTIPTPAGRLGIGICYDFDYAQTALRLVHNGAEVLACGNPTTHIIRQSLAGGRTAFV